MQNPCQDQEFKNLQLPDESSERNKEVLRLMARLESKQNDLKRIEEKIVIADLNPEQRLEEEFSRVKQRNLLKQKDLLYDIESIKERIEINTSRYHDLFKNQDYNIDCNENFNEIFRKQRKEYLLFKEDLDNKYNFRYDDLDRTLDKYDVEFEVDRIDNEFELEKIRLLEFRLQELKLWEGRELDDITEKQRAKEQEEIELALYQCGEEAEFKKREEIEQKNLLQKIRAKKNIKEEREEDISTRYISKSVRREVWRRDRGRCVECGSRVNLEYDHIIPFSKGGSNTGRNIQLLCQDCNRKKYNNL